MSHCLLFFSKDSSFKLSFQNPCDNFGFFVYITKNEMIDYEACTILTIVLPHLADLRDFENTEATIVTSGRSILLQQPTVPKWMLENQADVREDFKDTERNANKELCCDLQAAKIGRAEYALRKTLIHLPDGEQCTSDFTADCKIEDGQEVQKNVHPHVLVLKELEELEQDTAQWARHQFNPVTFEVRLFTERLSLKRAAKINVNKLSAGLKGTKPRARVTSMD
jgi:hypothetical protein